MRYPMAPLAQAGLKARRASPAPRSDRHVAARVACQARVALHLFGIAPGAPRRPAGSELEVKLKQGELWDGSGRREEGEEVAGSRRPEW